ncbi:TonB-dependent receptor [Flavobacterium faecale]|uniref:TonB-dependent receptor n=1 Tax=Flavobacterium faecale TaxID=1355330 RepID=UPI003AABC602
MIVNFKSFKGFTALYVLFSSTIVLGQIKKDTISLSELVLLRSPIQNTIQNAAAAVSIISESELRQNDGLIVTSILNKIPGVYMQQGALNTNRITIRGVGARTQYGTSRIKAYFEDIPLSTVEGETVLEDIDLEAIGRIEIIKGPNASSFGAGLGGVISLSAKKSQEERFYLKSAATYGSFGLWKQVLSTGFNNAGTSIFLNYNHLKQDGYRDNSNYDRQSMNLFGKHQFSVNTTLSFFGINTRLKAFIPSSINETSFRTNPKAAASSWLAAQGFESYDKLQTGISFEHQFSNHWTTTLSLFGTVQEAFEARPFDILEDDLKSIGFRANTKYQTSVWDKPIVFCIGTEYLTEGYDYSLFKNLYASNPGQGTVQGDRFAAFEQNRGYWNGFVQMEMELSNKLHLESGLAFNSTHYNQEAVFENNGNPKEYYTFGTIWSPRLGLSYEWSSGNNIYASLSKGFSVPTVAETLTADRKINKGIQAEIGLNYEVGYKGNFWNKKLYTEFILYTMQIKNLLVAQRVSEDQYVGFNAGEVLHPGLEFLLNYKYVLDGDNQITPYFSGSVNRFRFQNFVDKDTDFSGNLLPGVPNSQFNLGLEYRNALGFVFNMSYRNTAKRFLEDANSKEINGYQLLDAKLQYEFMIVKNIKLELNVGAQNIGNEKYAASVLPNAVAFGNALPRYYYPGNPRNYYGGIAATYLFD